MSYLTDLEETKKKFPFDDWYKSGIEFGMEQYTRENCDRGKAILEKLVASLVSLGGDSGEPDKLGCFRDAVLALNELNDDLDGSFIETGEREDLCALISDICTAAGMNPEKYGDGEGPASEWRDW